jgi:hypothetical protein
MKMTVFPSDKGDCFLVTSADGKNLLVDGGMRRSYSQYAADRISELDRLDVICVSHIDQDHISGVLQLMDDMLDWRVHDYQIEAGNAEHNEPFSPRPPEVGQIWHNAFDAQLPFDEGVIQSALSLRAAVLEVTETKKGRELAQEHRDLATSIPEAINLNQRIGPRQLNIPLNVPFEGDLMLVSEEPPEIKVGDLNVHIIGPFQKEIDDLREEWGEWLEKNEAALAKLRDEAERDEGSIGNEIGRLVSPLLAQAGELGNMKKVTVPNLASLMLLVEERDKTFLLTGDGHHDHVLAGLTELGKLDGAGGFHTDVLKVPHHGSEHNIHADFCKVVTANHYVFCANGAHENPDLRVVEMIIDSRVGSAETKSTNPEVDHPFTLWFNSSAKLAENEAYQHHMKEVEDLVKARAEDSGDRFEYFFLGADGSTENLSIPLEI